MAKRLEGRTAFVTGSSRGVGQQIALGLAAEGCDIILHGTKESNCDHTRNLLEQYEVNVIAVGGDLGSQEAVDALVAKVKSLDCPIDVLYNNAAIMESYNADFLDFSWDTWRRTMEINVFALYQMCGAFIPGMIERGYGRIVNLTSGIAHTPELAPYSSSKWAVRKLTEDLAYKCSGTNVKINALDPGWLRTDMGSMDAPNPVEAVLPGALVPVLLDKSGEEGKVFEALNYRT